MKQGRPDGIRIGILAVVLGAICAAAPQIVAATDKPTLSVDDVLSLEDYGSIVPVRDGQEFLFELLGSFASLDEPRQPLLDGRDGSHIYRVAPDGAVHPLFGQDAGMGYALGAVSPDGRRVLILRHDRETIDLLAFDLSRNALALVDKDIDMDLERGFSAPAWLDKERVFYRKLEAPGVATLARIERYAGDAISALHARQRTMVAVTATVLENPAPREPVATAEMSVRLADVGGGDTRVLARGSFARILASPDGKIMAMVRRNEPLSPAIRGMQESFPYHRRLDLVVVDIATGDTSVPLDTLTDVYAGTLHWSEDSKRLAFATRPVGPQRDNAPAAVFEWQTATRTAAKSRLDRPQRLLDAGDRWGAGPRFPGYANAVAQSLSGDGARVGAYLIDVRRSEQGFFLRRTDRESGEVRTLHAINRMLAERQLGTPRSYSYRFAGGAAESIGWILTPPGFDPGKRYPVVVSAYPGVVFSPDVVPAALHFPLDTLQLIGAAGYVVLLPSVPIDEEQVESGLMRNLAPPIEGAVQKLIEDGVADPKRIHLFGGSWGGYLVYSVLATSGRFRSGIACAGWGNHSSFYGQFDPRTMFDRYSAPGGFSHAGWLEDRRHGVGGAMPWERPDRYVAESPLFHADRIDAPVLIVQGDLDHVPLQQGQEMYTALARQNKRVKFLIQWGEGHFLPTSPANYREFWRTIVEWLRENGGPDPACPGSAITRRCR